MSMRPGAAAKIRSAPTAATAAEASAPMTVRRSTPCSRVMSAARRYRVFDDHLVETVAEFVGDVDGPFVRARDRVNRVEPAGQASQLAERAEHLAREIQLVDLADAADENDLIRPGRDAHRPGQAVERPLLLERAPGVEHLDAAVLPIGDVQVLVAIDHDAVRRVELARLRTAVAPVLHQVAFARELHHPRVAVAVSDVGAPVGT